VISSFPRLELLSFSYVGDDGLLHQDAAVAAANRCDYGCGLFEFTKRDSATENGHDARD